VKNMTNRSLGEILQSTSGVLFPAELGEAKVNIDSVDADGDTPLHVLIWQKDAEGAIKLIENGALLNAPGDMGETPLHIAILQNEIEVIKALLKAGARTDIVSEFGKTALDRATEQGISLSAFLDNV
jgi:ankyrin repeat protein